MTWDEERVASDVKTPMRVGKLLFFELTGRDSFEDGEARLSGARDGKWGGKFRGIYGLGSYSPHVLATGRAGGQLCLFGRSAMLKTAAAQAAGFRDRLVGVKGHRTISRHRN